MNFETLFFKRPWAFLVAFATITRLPALTFPRPIDDEQIYSVVGMSMVQGGLPYIDAVERKPPLLFWLYAFIFKLFGHYNFYAVHMTMLMWTLLTMLGLFVIGKNALGRREGFAAAFLYGAFLPWFDYRCLAFNGEMIMNMPIVFAFAVVCRVRSRAWLDAMWGGALIGIAFLLKQPAAIAGLALASFLLFRYRSLQSVNWKQTILDALAMVVGLLTILALAAMILFHYGIFREAYEWTLGDHKLEVGFWQLAFWELMPVPSAVFVAEHLPLLFLASMRMRESSKEAVGIQKTLLVWLGVSVIGVCASGQFNPHYYIQLLPPLSLLASQAFVVGCQQGVPARPLSRLATMGTLVVSLLFLIVNTLGLARSSIRQPTDAAKFISSHSQESDRIFVWGQSGRSIGLYLDAKRMPASRFVAVFPLIGMRWVPVDPRIDASERIDPKHWRQLEEDFKRHPPSFIVDAQKHITPKQYQIREYPWMRACLAQYHLVYQAEDGDVYQKNSL